MFRKILVPVDGSDCSWKGLAYAEEIAEKFSSQLLVLNVEQVYNANLLALPMDNVYMDQMLSENGENLILKNAQEKIEKYTGKVQFISEKGHPAEQILIVAAKMQCDLIVIGSRGLSGIAEFLLGSVSTRISEYSQIPVLIVK
ncbi:universal stress protein [Succinispira mobilis]|uniref:universal stress protein n=1 Tax=Succinispira mobilis TaxID=78120 RepID=UPI0003779097|nr:universal stress protein [Succinispira mobilis]